MPLAALGELADGAVGEALPALARVGGGLARRDRQHGVEQQDAALCPRREVAGRGPRAARGRVSSSSMDVLQRRRRAHAGGNREAEPHRLAGAVVGILAEDHDAHVVERRQRERVEDAVGRRVEARARPRPRRRGTTGAPPCRAARARRRAPRASSRASAAAFRASLRRASERQGEAHEGVDGRHGGSGSTSGSQSIGGDRRLERIFATAAGSKGPAYSPAWRCLLFSDIPNDRTLRWDEASGVVGTSRSRPGTPTAARSTGRDASSHASTAAGESRGPITTVRRRSSPTAGSASG